VNEFSKNSIIDEFIDEFYKNSIVVGQSLEKCPFM